MIIAKNSPRIHGIRNFAYFGRSIACDWIIRTYMSTILKFIYFAFIEILGLR